MTHWWNETPLSVPCGCQGNSLNIAKTWLWLCLALNSIRQTRSSASLAAGGWQTLEPLLVPAFEEYHSLYLNKTHFLRDLTCPEWCPHVELISLPSHFAMSNLTNFIHSWPLDNFFPKKSGTKQLFQRKISFIFYISFEKEKCVLFVNYFTWVWPTSIEPSLVLYCFGPARWFRG